jgi:hypothetical protein
MASGTFDELPESEQENFFDTCFDANLAPAAFNVSFTEEAADEEGIKTHERCVIVLFGTITRTYDGSGGADWTIDFAEDVRSHVFA